MKLAYLVHDLNDAAVSRRVAMLVAAGVEVRLAGFWRGEEPPTAICGAPVTPLRRTYDARLLDRFLSVLNELILSARLRRAVAGADVIMARNLEMLTLGAFVRGRSRLVYECLDILRPLFGAGPPNRMLRACERWLLARVDLLLVSSPAFLTHYFEARQCYSGPSLLVENKVVEFERTKLPAHRPTAPRPALEDRLVRNSSVPQEPHTSCRACAAVARPSRDHHARETGSE